MKTVFLRVHDADDKATALLAAIREPHAALGKQRFEADLTTFANVPRSPFAYWVSDGLRRLFLERQPFEAPSLGRIARRGAGTNDDFRFLRLWFEVGASEQRWVPHAKGGLYSAFYSQIYLVIEWWGDGAQLKAFFIHNGESPSRNIRSESEYRRPGLTWPLRTTSRMAMRAMPAGCIFASKDPAAFVEGDDSQGLLSLLAISNSSIFGAVTELQLAAADAAARSYEVGVIQRNPFPQLTASSEATLAVLSHRAWSVKRSLDTRDETSRAFTLPALLQVGGDILAERITVWSDRVRRIEAELATIQQEINALCFDLYEVDEADRLAIANGFGGAGALEAADAESDVNTESEAEESAIDAASLAAELVSWTVGSAFGRFDVRLAIGTRAMPPEPEPFDSLPRFSPGMLTADDGLPLVSEPGDYPLRPPEGGILADDSGNALDLVTAVRAMFETIFGDSADARLQESAALLDSRDGSLRAWLAKGFFEHHLKRYSKSRRQAPIYWPLATTGDGYTIWLYAHRFSRDTLFQALNDFAKPKLQHERRALEQLRTEAGEQPTRSQRDVIEALESFVAELQGFVEELERVAPLWNPDLNDGVIINYAPLWRMIGHTPWRKNVKECWDTLCAGDYDWSHLAMHLWPERVVPKCATDRSRAIAHGLEDEFWVEGVDGKWNARSTPSRPVEDLVLERSSSAVKAALKILLEAPSPGGATKRARKGKTHA
jgi:hypothetical protein